MNCLNELQWVGACIHISTAAIKFSATQGHWTTDHQRDDVLRRGEVVHFFRPLLIEMLGDSPRLVCSQPAEFHEAQENRVMSKQKLRRGC